MKDNAHQDELDKAFGWTHEGQKRQTMFDGFDPANMPMRFILLIMATVVVLVLWASPDPEVRSQPTPANEVNQLSAGKPSKLDKPDTTVVQVSLGKQGE